MCDGSDIEHVRGLEVNTVFQAINQMKRISLGEIIIDIRITLK
jgi:hypothetical protein